MKSGNNFTSSIKFHLLVGFLVRLGCMAFGMWQDSVMRVKYTDIDYHVFTDAARFVTEGESPYRRATFRYTPLVAWLLTPNIYLHATWGKVLFIICDVLTGYMIYNLIKLRPVAEKTAVFCASLWLLNPLPITVSSRGNAESILSFLTLTVMYLLTRKSQLASIIAYMLYGLTVHMKIYPVTYALPMYLMYEQGVMQTHAWSKLTAHIWPSWRRLQLVVVSAGTFFLLTALCYWIYGYEFLDETYLYHVTRRDTRHNFSVYFYLLYLTEGSTYSGILGLIIFFPQAALLLVASFRYYDDLPFCCFITTFIFVTFNKVCTSQYFLWYLCLLPLVVPQINMSVRRAATLTVLWFAGQALWLLPAYYFEFEGKDTFFYIWLASINFFIINIAIMCNIVKYYTVQKFPVAGLDMPNKKRK